jgi:hypothetical protein
MDIIVITWFIIGFILSIINMFVERRYEKSWNKSLNPFRFRDLIFILFMSSFGPFNLFALIFLILDPP